jgi:uncharacterized metal-binding protein YceD (DUF177 family)
VIGFFVIPVLTFVAALVTTHLQGVFYSWHICTTQIKTCQRALKAGQLLIDAHYEYPVGQSVAPAPQRTRHATCRW